MLWPLQTGREEEEEEGRGEIFAPIPLSLNIFLRGGRKLGEEAALFLEKEEAGVRILWAKKYGSRCNILSPFLPVGDPHGIRNGFALKILQPKKDVFLP